MTDIQIFGEAEEKTIEQMRNCVAVEDGALGVLCADNHLGYSQPVGGAVAYREHISPSGVGYDIGCGNKAVRTELDVADVKDSLAGIADEIERRVSFGIGLNDGETVDHPVLDAIRGAEFRPQAALLDKAANQLGTVGAGNHYVDLFADADGKLWVGVHFGSRGFGHTTCKGFLRLANGETFQGKGDPEGEPMSPPVVFHVDSDIGQAYIAAMELAGEYAYAGRNVVVDRVLEILGTRATYEVHNHHNFAWQEEHFGEQRWVIRKGCTPAFPGQAGFVGSTMGEASVILEGAEHGTSRLALYSTVHGAGRVMSRTKAKGKGKPRWVCNAEECGWVQPKGTHKPDACPDCSAEISKRRIVTEPGLIDWPTERSGLEELGIILRGGDADEAPGAYKRLAAVLEAQGETISILNQLEPLVVVMAAPDTFDPFKD